MSQGGFTFNQLQRCLRALGLPERVGTISGGTMLVLSRKTGERILIGDNIAITVVRITGSGVRLGIEAPPEMVVVREELAEQLSRVEAEKARTHKAAK